MTLAALLDQLAARGVKVWAQAGELRIQAPKHSLDEDLRRSLRAHKPELLRLLGSATREDAPAALVAVCRDGPSPLTTDLSVSQEGLWFHNRQASGNASYNLPIAIPIDAAIALDVERLRASFDAVVARHEALRTTFPLVAGRPVQQVQPPSQLPFAIVDLRDNPETAQAELERGAAEAFDLEHDLPVRARLVRLDNSRYLLQVVFHHIAVDGWSLGCIFADWAHIYGRMSQHLPIDLAPLPFQYADFTVWQRSWLSEARVAEQLRWWTERFADAPAVLELPTDRPRPPVLSFRGTSLPCSVDAQTTQQVRELARRRGVTLYVVLLAAFATLLRRVSGQHTVVIGAPFANRKHPDLSAVVGYFVNTLPLRIDLAGTFAQVLERAQRMVVGALAHADVPFPRIVEALRPARTASHAPVFQVMLALNIRPALDSGQSSLPPGALTSAASKYDLTLSFEDAGAELLGSLEYSSDLFDAAHAQVLADSFRSLLKAAVLDEQQPIDALPLHSEAERQRLLQTQKGTARKYPELPVSRLIEAQVDRSPDAPAVVFAHSAITYAELDARANRLAHRLVAAGAGPEKVVAVCMERSVELVVALLAVMKSGAAWLPLSMEDPPARRDMLTHAASAILVLTEEGTGDEPDQRLTHTPAPEQAVYVIYTSGSSGQPKGVVNVHAGLTNRLCWMQEAFALSERDAVLQKTPTTFDVSVWEFFWPLMTGARLVVAPAGAHRDPAAVAALIARHDITTVHFVPSMLAAFLPAAGDLPSLQRVFCSGEALTPELRDRFFDTFATCARIELHNLYGPTEAAIDVSWWACAKHADPHVVPIGRPIANTALYVLDERRQLAAVGVPGELYIGGRNLARGYLGRDDLTAERFVADPFHSGQRLYRTGDCARLRADGAILFLGRNDDQVKVRGFRVELAEIELALTRVAGVHSAAAAVRDQSIVAWVTASDAASLDLSTDSSTLRKELAKRLPSYMLPASIDVLDRLPTLSSGKTDRKALLARDVGQARQPSGAQPLQTGLQAAVASAWKRTMGLQEVGQHDDFFELGGHSLMALRLLAEINTTLGIEVPLQTFLTRPTVAAMADFAATCSSDTTRGLGCLVPIQTAGSAPPFFCAPPLAGSPVVYTELARHLGPNQPFYGIQVPGLLASERPLQTIDAIADLAVQAIRRIQPEGPYHVGGWSFGALIAWRMAEQLEVAGQRVGSLALIDAGPEPHTRPPTPLRLLEARLTTALRGLSILAQVGLPRSYPQLRTLGQWIGVSLPPDRSRLVLRTLQSELACSLRVMRANAEAARRFRARPLAAPVLLLRASEETSPRDPLAARLRPLAPLEVRPVCGNHMTMMLNADRVAELAAALRQRLGA